MRDTTPLVKLLKPEVPQRAIILAVSVWCGCSDGKMREVELTPKLGRKLLGFIQQHHDGKIELKAAQKPLSREESEDKPQQYNGFTPTED